MALKRAQTKQIKNFFFLGPKNNWEKLLNKDIREKIELIFKKEMEELNYL